MLSLLGECMKILVTTRAARSMLHAVVGDEGRGRE